MIIDNITQDDVMIVLEHVRAACLVRSYCDGCQYHIPGDGCALAHLPESWKLFDIKRKGKDQDD